MLFHLRLISKEFKGEDESNCSDYSSCLETNVSSNIAEHLCQVKCFYILRSLLFPVKTIVLYNTKQIQNKIHNHITIASFSKFSRWQIRVIQAMGRA